MSAYAREVNESDFDRAVLQSKDPAPERRSGIKCQRCLGDEEAIFRVYTDTIDMKVCFACSEEAGRLGIAVEILHSRDRMKRYQVL